MYDNYNYPPGADTPDAPWNEHDTEPIEVNADVTVTLQNTLTVTTNNYVVDEDGTDLLDKYSDIEELVRKQHKSIPALLAELEKYINKELQGDVSRDVSYTRKCELRKMLEDCQGWEQAELDVDDFNKC